MPVTRPGGRDIRDGSITDADIASENKDGLPAVPSLRTLGTGAQQAAAGDDPRLTYPDSYFRQTGSSPQRWYVCGKMNAAAGSTSATTKNLAYFMPFRTNSGFVLMGAGVGNTTAPGPSQVNLALFDSIGPQNLHPNNLVAELGVTNLNTIGPPFLISPLAIPLPSNSVYWLAVVFGGGGPGVQTTRVPASSAEPILGLPPSLSGAGGIGYTAPIAIGPFPATILPATTTILTTNAPYLVYTR